MLADALGEIDAQLRTVLDFIGKGDVLLVTRVDRLARSIGDLQDIVRFAGNLTDNRHAGTDAGDFRRI